MFKLTTFVAAVSVALACGAGCGNSDNPDACIDSDNDFICDDFDTNTCLDADEDGVCDETGDPNLCIDSDGDGVCDEADVCEGEDDLANADGDDQPDACDPCPADNPNDADGDSVCDGIDVCFGADSSGDTDGDGICDDATALNPVRNLSAVATGTDVTVTWSNPSGATFADVLVVRSMVRQSDGTLANGQTYAVGETLGTSGEVVYVGTAETLDDSGLATGLAMYSVWARNTAGVWSRAAHDGDVIDEGAQTGDLSVALGTGVVTVNNMPAGWAVSGAGTYDAAAQTLSVDITLTSNIARYINSPKFSVTATGGGTYNGGDGNIDTVPFTYFGPEAAMPGVAITRTLNFVAVDGATDPLTLGFDILNHRLALAPSGNGNAPNWVDMGGSGLTGAIECSLFGFKLDKCDLQQGVISADGTKFYMGSRNRALIVGYDLGTLEANRMVELANYGSTSLIRESEDGSLLYAILNHTHRYDSGDDDPTIELVRLEADSLAITGRVELRGVMESDAIGRDFALSPDGTKAAVTIRDMGLLYMVDLTTMTIIDGNAKDAEEDGFDLTTFGANRLQPNNVVFNQAGTNLFIGYRSNQELDIVNISTLAQESTVAPLTTPTGSAQTSGLVRGPGGRIFWGRQSSGVVIVAGAGNVTEIIDSVQVVALALDEDQNTLWLGASRQDEIYALDLANNVLIDLDGDTTDGVLGPAPDLNGGGGHLLMVSPY